MSEKEWVTQARERFRFHRSKLLSQDGWTIGDTAEALQKSKGLVSEDITIARWLRTHETQILKCHTRTEALEFIRQKKKQMDLGDDE